MPRDQPQEGGRGKHSDEILGATIYRYGVGHGRG